MTLPFILTFAIIIMVVVMIFASIPPAAYGSVTRSTVKREPLPRSSVVEAGYYTDELGWIGNQTKLTAGMRNFYAKTGVQPHLYITDSINGSHNPSDIDLDNFAYEVYDRLFSDEAHLLLIFFEYNSRYHTWYLCGTQAKTVIDNEAADILLDYVDKYYYSDMNEEEFFSRAFDDAAKRIMSVTVSPWVYVGAVAAVLAIIIIAFIWWSRAKKQKNLEAERTERILNTPLETFGDKNVDDLKGKYDDK